MSLINDALQRAKQAQPDPSLPAAGGHAMEPVRYPRPRLPWYFIPVLLAVIAGGGWFLIKGWDARRQAAAGYGTPITIKAREPVTPILPPARPSTPEPDRPSTPPAANSPTATPFAGVNRNFSLEDSPPAGAAAAPAPDGSSPATPPAAGPTFKLQGIFYRSASPSAMINGKSVFIGDRVSGARIKAIDRESVTLEYDGQTKTLTIE